MEPLIGLPRSGMEELRAGLRNVISTTHPNGVEPASKRIVCPDHPGVLRRRVSPYCLKPGPGWRAPAGKVETNRYGDFRNLTADRKQVAASELRGV